MKNLARSESRQPAHSRPSPAAAAGTVDAGAARAMPRPSAEDGPAPSILLVDDLATNIDFLEAVLKAAGFPNVTGTTDPRAAVGLYRELQPALVLLDINMPECDGFEVMRQLRADNPESPPNVLVITGETEREIRRRALREGASDFLVRPFDDVEMLSRVRNLVAMQQLRHRLEEHNRGLEDTVAKRTKRLEDAMSVLQHAETKLLRALAESEKTSRAKSDFLASISHEIRTPLNAIIGYSQLLLDEIVNSEHRQYTKLIFDAGTYLLNLINDILDYSKADADKLDIEITDVNLPKTIRSCVGLVKQRADDAGVTLKMDIAPNFPVLKTDEKRLKQVILNLVTNAIKFTPPGGNVTVKAWADPKEGAFILIVSDTGIGIAPEKLELVMKPYGQVKSKQSEKHQGTGLGLPLTKRIVDRLGGRLEIHSQVGVGTAVRLVFPLDCSAAQRE
ncbi:MAG: ATP-binding protein [Alphaproteobacteria bacterium]